MLDTTFKMCASQGRAKEWSYIGRFIWGFALVEYQVNQLFDEILNLGYGAHFVLTYSLDLRKKLRVMEVILKSQGNDQSKTFKRVHELHDVRNVLAHWPFFEADGGLSCDYINERGETEFHKPRAREKDNLIKYTEFDSYDAEASALYEILDDLLNSVTSITDVGDDLRAGIEEAITSSDNVLRLPSRLRKDDEGESGQ